MSLAQGNNTTIQPRIEPGSPDPESDGLTTRPVRSPIYIPVYVCVVHQSFESTAPNYGDSRGIAGLR